MRLLHRLDMAWRVVKTVTLPLVGLFFVLASLVMEYPVWRFYVPMVILYLVPVILRWESRYYYGSMLIALFWSVLCAATNTSIPVRLMLLALFGGPAFAMLVVYESELWDETRPERSFDRFPYRLVGPRRRLELGLELDRSYAGQTHDVEQLAYCDDTRDLVYEVALRAPNESVRRAVMAKLHYPEDAELIRKLATTMANEETRLAALLMLPYPDEATFLTGELVAYPAYEHYDLELGWPHRHRFKHASMTTEGSGSCRTETEVLACTCGMTMTVVSRVTRTERYGQCPECGADIQQVFPGGGYEWAYQCTHCTWESDGCADYGEWGPYVEESTQTLSTTYAMKDTEK